MSDRFEQLLASVGDRSFIPHEVEHLLDQSGQHRLSLAPEFPLQISLFHFVTGKVTQKVTWHHRLEFLLPLDGPFEERIGSKKVSLAPGDLLVVDNLQPHQAVDHPQLDTRVIVVTFQPEFVYSLGSPSSDYAFLVPFNSQIHDQPRILLHTATQAPPVYQALQNLIEAYFQGKDQASSQTGCKAWLLVLLHHLVSALATNPNARDPQLKRHQIDATRLQPVFDHIRQHYTRRIPVATAAKMAGLSEAQFARVFRRVAGMTFASYVNHVRLAHAMPLLHNSELTIAEIANQLGYSDQSHFDKRFRQALGKTPSQYRQGAAS